MTEDPGRGGGEEVLGPDAIEVQVLTVLNRRVKAIENVFQCATTTEHWLQ